MMTISVGRSELEHVQYPNSRALRSALIVKVGLHGIH